MLALLAFIRVSSLAITILRIFGCIRHYGTAHALQIIPG